MNGNRPEPLIIVPLALAIGGYPALSPRQSRRPLPESYLDGNLRCPGVYLAEGRESFVFLLAGWVFRMVRRIRTCSEIACPCSRAPGGDPPQAATPPQRTMAVSAMAALVIAAQEADLHRASIQGRRERPDGAPPAQGHQLLPTKMQHEISPTGMPARPEPAQGPPTTGGPPPLQESQRTPGRGEHSPDKAPVARKSARSSPPWPSEPRPKERRCRPEGCRRRPWRRWLAAKLGRRPPRGNRSPRMPPTPANPRAATPRVRKASGLPQRRSPGPLVASGRKRVRSRTPRKSPRVGGSSGPRARPWTSHARGRPPWRGAAPGGAAALNSSRSYALPTRELGTPRIADPPQGSPRAAAAVAPRTAASESAPGGRSPGGEIPFRTTPTEPPQG